MSAFLPDQSRITQVHLRTANLGRGLTFYSFVLGLRVVPQPGARALLVPDKESPGLILLSEETNAAPRPPRSTGLYHFALRYPRRQDLACAYRRLQKINYPVDGASDHGVSEAIYLTDPDGNGVELCVDRPRAQWPWRKGAIEMVTKPLDLENLLATAAESSASAGTPPQVDLGHIHLHVPDLAAAERFYSDFLGLAVTQRSYPGALFFAAGAYHHHVGVNVWAGKAAPPPNSVGLISYRFEVSVAEILYCLNHRAPLLGYETRTESDGERSPTLQIRDPNGNWLEIQARETASAGIENQPCRYAVANMVNHQF
jgi:catechol 2,3-dioxygenase